MYSGRLQLFISNL